MADDRFDPYGGYNFSVRIGGIERAGFRECSGLDSSQNGIEYREGTDKNLAPRKLPGLNTYADITLSRGVTKDKQLWEWRAAAMKGEAKRQNVSIVLQDAAGADKITWHLVDCWPKQWTGPSFNATSDEVAVEQLVLAYERLSVDKWT